MGVDYIWAFSTVLKYLTFEKAGRRIFTHPLDNIYVFSEIHKLTLTGEMFMYSEWSVRANN